jgi:hypothetical protein
MNWASIAMHPPILASGQRGADAERREVGTFDTQRGVVQAA